MTTAPPQARIRVSTLTHVGAGQYMISGCAVHVLRNLDPSRFTGEIWAGHATEVVQSFPEVRLSLPPLFFRAASKFRVPTDLIESWTEYRFLKSLHPGALIWAFPAWRRPLYKQLRERGHKIVLERVNSAIANSHAILSELSQRHGVPLPRGVDQEEIENERFELEMSDYVFVCSPFVESSFLKLGVPPNKLIRCSYGWDPTEYKFPQSPHFTQDTPRFLFVGTGSMRKGLPDLLALWQRLKPPARLRIVGPIDPPIAQRYADVLRRDDVEVFGFDFNLTHHYLDSHVFILPSYEEGSPLVTYIALGAGIPSLVSYAGAGGIVRDNKEGLVCDPANPDAFAEAIMRLATDGQLRERLGTAAKAASAKFTWREVAKARAEVFSGVLSPNFDATKIGWPVDAE